MGILCASVVGSELVVVNVYMSGMERLRVFGLRFGWKGKLHWRYTHMKGNGNWYGHKGVVIYLPALNNKGVGIDNGCLLSALERRHRDFFDSGLRFENGIYESLVVLNSCIYV